ncbi:MAG: TolC family protein [Sedimentisphaerales bacterium]|jgi:outer membrane protein TolC|nr:TolC family protein [Sedimentisphaerales bacterium]
MCRAGLDQIICIALCLAAFQAGGCVSAERVKERVDQQAYQMIDQKWQPSFGTKANYRISDVTPSPNDVPVDQPIPPALGTLTIAQAVALATGHNPEYQIRREALYAKALELRLTRHQFERRYLGLISGTYRGDRNDQILSTEAATGFNQLLADGTQVGATLTAAWADVVSGNLRGGLAAILGLAVTKPLLRGSDRQVVLEGLTQAERDLLYEVRSFNHFRKGFVVDVISDYYRILVILDHIENAKDYQETLKELLDLAVPLAQAGRIGTFEVDRIKQEIISIEDQIVRSRGQYQQMLDEFKLKLGIPTTTRFDLDPRELSALRQSTLPCPQVQEQEVLDTALARRLDLANEADRVLDAQRKVLVARDRLKADLNIVGWTNASTNMNINRRTLTILDNEFSVGLEADLPLDRVAEENQYRLALIAVNQQKRTYQQTVDTVCAQVRQSFRKLMESAQRYQLARQGVDLARQRFDSTMLLLRHNRTNTRRVLDALQDLYDAKDKGTAALADYAISTLRFYHDTGILQVRPDGMWQL